MEDEEQFKIMEVTTYSYRFPLRETFQYWDITYNQATSSEGLTKIVAKIQPSFCELLKFLKERMIITEQDITTDSCGNYIAQTHNGKILGDLLVNFCTQYFNVELSAWGYSFGDAFVGGDTRCSDKAIKKIKKKLIENYPESLTKKFVEFLQNKGAI